EFINVAYSVVPFFSKMTLGLKRRNGLNEEQCSESCLGIVESREAKLCGADDWTAVLRVTDSRYDSSPLMKIEVTRPLTITEWLEVWHNLVSILSYYIDQYE